MTGRAAMAPGMLAAVLSAVVLAVSLGPVRPVLAEPSDDPVWSPAASERLVRLPSGYLERAIERDYSQSGLARAIGETAAELEDRSRGLAELQRAAREATGAARDELRHQAIEQKRRYVETMERRLLLERERIETRVALLDRLLAEIDRSGAGETEADARLRADREAALARFEASRETIDMALLRGGALEESRYAQEYRTHAAALRKLTAAIADHPMNRAPETDGRPLDRREHIRLLLAAAESERAVLDQRELVLAHMARLVALDAMALADEMAERAAVGRGRPEEHDLMLAIDAFVDE